MLQTGLFLLKLWRIEMQRIELCSNRCCPTLTKETTGDVINWIITDDFGGKVSLTDEQISNFVDLIMKHNADEYDRLSIQH